MFRQELRHAFLALTYNPSESKGRFRREDDIMWSFVIERRKRMEASGGVGPAGIFAPYAAGISEAPTG